jgi:hypothetical protein
MHTVVPAFDMKWRVLLGVHTCDLHAMCMLDEAFARGQPDTHYMKRRATTAPSSVWNVSTRATKIPSAKA